MDDECDELPIDPKVDVDVADESSPQVLLHRWSRLARPDVLLVISLGGMLGASARFGIAQWIPTSPGGFPWGTLWANLIGSFLLGFLLVIMLEHFPNARLLRPFVATGIIGALTTMSTYQVETALLLKDGHVATGLVYGLGTLAAGLALAYAGMAAGRATGSR